jgi:hypothetical protein
MIREEFKQELDDREYSYEEEGNKIIVNPDEEVYLYRLNSIPSGVQFRNRGSLYLKGLMSIPPDTGFENTGSIGLNSITSIPSTIEFRNGGDVYLNSLIKELVWDAFRHWKGNIEGIGSTRLLNKMIKDGLFEK